MSLDDAITRRLAEPNTYELGREQTRTIVQALRMLPAQCQYHGDNFERLGIEPWANRAATHARRHGVGGRHWPCSG